MEKEEPKYHILNDGDFTLGKFSRTELKKIILTDFSILKQWPEINCLQKPK